MVIDIKRLIKKYYWIIIMVMAFIPSRMIYDYYMSSAIRNRFIILDTLNISGTIVKSSYYNGGSTFKLNIRNETIYFPDLLVLKKQIPDGKWLYDIAEKGDSIYKAAFSDTLFLYKQNGKNYFFVFDRNDLYR
jgi:hypothetical protein